MEQLVAQPNGRWDVNTLVSPALAAALEAAPARSVEEADAIFQELHDALEALHKGKSEWGLAGLARRVASVASVLTHQIRGMPMLPLRPTAAALIHVCPQPCRMTPPHRTTTCAAWPRPLSCTSSECGCGYGQWMRAV